ncbi:hypothetical protein KC887_01495 [Candidatus Kaiserbacteria bacterium]|nr:hypothetical protein [Candidatus Kaiserbacteria bacterium]
MTATTIVFKEEARAPYLTTDGNVDWNKVEARWTELKSVKESLGNKHFTPKVKLWAEGLSPENQQRLLDVMLGGLSNDDASVGVYATRPEDYVEFAPYLEPIIREYHKIEGEVTQRHDWNIPVGVYELTDIDPSLRDVSMRARVARNVAGWNLPSSMDQEERVAFEQFMTEEVFSKLPFAGTYYSLTPGHPAEINEAEADAMRADHFLFNDMTTDNHLTSAGIASDWPYGRGIWLSEDKQKMIWVGEEDHLRIISIVHGSDLGEVDKSLSDLLKAMEAAGVEFAEHPTYGVITTCPTNMGTGKRQSVLVQFPNLSKAGTDEASLKATAKGFGLQARGLAGEHSNMDENGTSDISPLARFGVTEAEVTRRLNDGLTSLLKAEAEAA